MTTIDESFDILRSTLQGTEFQHNVYLVGGAVRDQLLRLPVKDLDFVVEGHGITGGIDCATLITKKLGNYREGSNPVTYPRFGTAKLVLPNGYDVEFVAPRREKYTPGSRKPVVEPGTLSDDAFRRDFTVNALFRRLSDNELLDPTGRGLDDLEQRRLSTSSEASIIFRDDPLRMIRAVRFAVKYSFEIPLSLIRAIKHNAHLLSTISRERIQDELNKILVLERPSRAVRLFKITGLLTQFAPELQALVGVKQNKFHDKDVFGHTLNVLDATPNDRLTRLSALFHDVGKLTTRTEVFGKVRFIGHAEVGVEIARTVMKRLKYSNYDIQHVGALILSHMDLKHADNGLNGLKDKHLRKLIFKTRDRFEPLLDLIHADNVSHAPDHRMPDQVSRIREHIASWDLEGILSTKSLLDGYRLVEMGASGRLIQDIKDRIVEKMLEHPNFSRHDAELLAENMIKARKGLDKGLEQ